MLLHPVTCITIYTIFVFALLDYLRFSFTTNFNLKLSDVENEDCQLLNEHTFESRGVFDFLDRTDFTGNFYSALTHIL